MAKGYTQKQITAELGFWNIHYLNMLSWGIFAKLGAKNKMQAVCIAIKNGIIEI